MTAVLESRDVNKAFGAVVAAADITLAVEEGEVLGMIGANGAGKTTFVNLVTGYLKPDSGRILYLGHDITARSPREITRLGLCRSFQIPQLFPELTVLDNALIALTIARHGEARTWEPVRRPGPIEDATAVLARYGIDEYHAQNAGTLPQGIRKLLDIAMATVGDPKLILLDEPTSGISIDEKFDLMDQLMGALKGRGATILFVEHDMEIVERYAQRVVAFYDGRIIAEGNAADVLADAEVQQFVVGTELHRRGTKEGPA